MGRFSAYCDIKFNLQVWWKDRVVFTFTTGVIGVSPEYENENEYVCDIESVTGTGPSQKYTAEQEDCDAETATI